MQITKQTENKPRQNNPERNSNTR